MIQKMLVDLMYAASVTVYYFLEDNFINIVILYLLACLPSFAYWFFREWLPGVRKYRS